MAKAPFKTIKKVSGELPPGTKPGRPFPTIPVDPTLGKKKLKVPKRKK